MHACFWLASHDHPDDATLPMAEATPATAAVVRPDRPSNIRAAGDEGAWAGGAAWAKTEAAPLNHQYARGGERLGSFQSGCILGAGLCPVHTFRCTPMFTRGTWPCPSDTQPTHPKIVHVACTYTIGRRLPGFVPGHRYRRRCVGLVTRTLRRAWVGQPRRGWSLVRTVWSERTAHTRISGAVGSLRNAPLFNSGRCECITQRLESAPCIARAQRHNVTQLWLLRGLGTRRFCFALMGHTLISGMPCIFWWLMSLLSVCFTGGICEATVWRPISARL
jgi:hypothetical protein